ncbi:MAG: hypothetical protein LBF41_01075 [Deltaproteobacteria bacterium]|jgi:hypothetical protein|nr:hypothetical protein [Deltaproteobacteria bacterium]
MPKGKALGGTNPETGRGKVRSPGFKARQGIAKARESTVIFPYGREKSKVFGASPGRKRDVIIAYWRQTSVVVMNIMF